MTATGVTYQWVQCAISEGAAKSVSAACERLGATLRKNPSLISAWYYSGNLMKDHKMDPGRTDSRSVRAMMASFNDLTKHDQLRAVDIVRRGGITSFKDLQKITRKSKTAAQANATRRAARTQNAGKLTPLRVKMEALALLTFAKALWGEEVSVSVYVGDIEKLSVS